MFWKNGLRSLLGSKRNLQRKRSFPKDGRGRLKELQISTIITKSHGVVVEELKDNRFSMEHLYQNA